MNIVFIFVAFFFFFFFSPLSYPLATTDILLSHTNPFLSGKTKDWGEGSPPPPNLFPEAKLTQY
jgi:hypothetical protein